MYVLILTAIIVTDPHLIHLSHTYSVWSLCIMGVPYLTLCTILCKYYCTIGLTMDKGPVGKQVLIPPVEGHVGIAKKPHMSLTASKRAQDWRDLFSRNWYVLVNWANPLDWIGKDRIGGQNVCPLTYLRSRRISMRSYEGNLKGGDVVEHSGPRPAPLRQGAIMGVTKGAPEENWFIASRFM